MVCRGYTTQVRNYAKWDLMVQTSAHTVHKTQLTPFVTCSVTAHWLDTWPIVTVQLSPILDCHLPLFAEICTLGNFSELQLSNTTSSKKEEKRKGEKYI